MNVRDSVVGVYRAWLAIAAGIFCLLVADGRLHAQPPSQAEIESVAGRSYIVAFPDTVINEHDHNFVVHTWENQIVVAIYSAVANTMSITGPAGYSKRDIALPANQFTIIDFNKPEWRSAYPIAWEIGKISNATFRIDAQEPVVIYCYLMTEFGAEAWTPLPIEKWGTEYYAAARDGEVVYDVIPGPNGYDKASKMAPGEIAMIAAYDNTQVTFHTNERLREDYNRAVTLNAGQIYTIQSWVDLRPDAFGDQQPDLGGTRIVATKPIAVISGNTRAQVLTEGEGLTQNPWKNMLIEWIPPLEQQGTEFVFMPTWDQRRPVGEYLEYKRQAEFVKLYATRPGQTEGFYTTGDIDGEVLIDPINQAAHTEFRFGTVPPRYFKTNKPAMAMMNSSAVVRFKGMILPGPPEEPDPEEPPKEPDTIKTMSRDYEGWGPYMVEMVPREQWTSFAPYWAPTVPADMEHYINVVTDSANAMNILREDGTRFVFNRGPIGNTGLIWGTTAVLPGVMHYLRSDNGGRFYAFGYGLLMGQEQYIFEPAVPPKPKEEGKFEHREYMAIAYGYPLSPRRNVLRTPDTLELTPTMGCTDLSLSVIARNAAPAGLRVIKLEPATNARIKSISPESYVGAANVTIVVEPIDRTQNASGTIELIDRTGAVTQVPYSYVAETVTFAPAGLVDFGEQTMNVPVRRDIVVTNPVDKTIEVTRLSLLKGNEDFRIVSSTPSTPTQLAKGASMTVTIEANPQRPGRLYIDSLVVETACTTRSVGLRMETVQPFLQINDVPFGDVTLFGQKDRPLVLCNVGRGLVTFKDSLGNDVITWGDNHFVVSDADKAKLRAMQLGPDQCDTIMVRFNATETGVFRTTAKVIANTRLHRDTSFWTATVRVPGPQVDAVEFGSRWLVNGPCSQNPATFYADSVEVFNTGSSDFDVVKLELVGADADAGFITFDTSDPLSTIKAGDRVRAVQGTDTMRRYQKILFKPSQERPYTATVKMTVVNPVTGIENSVENTVTGTGVLSHIALGDRTFDTVSFVAGSTVVPGTVSFEILPSRATTITDVQVQPNTGEFVVTNLAALRRTWQVGETGTVQLEFRPTSAGLRTARLVIVGDQSSCDEPGGALIGFTRGSVAPTDTAGVAITGVDFGAIAGCHDSTANITVRNTGTVAATVTGISVINGGPEFSVAPLGSPVTIAVGATSTFAVRFTPSSAAPASGTVRFTVTFAGQPQIERDVTLSGSGAPMSATAAIGNVPNVVAGDPLDVPIMLSTAVNAGKVSDLTVVMRYDREMLRAITSDPTRIVSGGLLNGWTTQVVSHTGDATNEREMVLTLRATAPAGTFLNGTGQLMKIPFRTLIGDTLRSALPFTITSASSPCVEFNTTPGVAALDSICGMSFRLIEASSTNYLLKQNAPNPFNPVTTIEFAVGLDARTTLTIYDASGRKVATLVDAFLQPGRYSVQWDASSHPSGLYYYRLNSSMWSRTNTMVLQK